MKTKSNLFVIGFVITVIITFLCLPDPPCPCNYIEDGKIYKYQDWANVKVNFTTCSQANGTVFNNPTNGYVANVPCRELKPINDEKEKNRN